VLGDIVDQTDFICAKTLLQYIKCKRKIRIINKDYNNAIQSDVFLCE